MRCAPELSEKENSSPRLAPAALPSRRHATNLTPPPPRHHARADLRLELNSKPHENEASNATEVPTTPRSPSFFDVGGLLGYDERPRRPTQHSLSVPQYLNFSRPTTPLHSASMTASRAPGSRKGSDALLDDIGGLRPPSTAGSDNRPSSRERGISLINVLRETGPDSLSSSQPSFSSRKESPPEMQDIGGLLSPDTARTTRRSMSEKRGISLVDVLRETEPNILQDLPPTLTQSKESPPEIQDIGGLLSPKPNQRRRDSASDRRRESLVDVLRETGPSMPSKQQPPLYKPKDGAMGLQDVGGLLS